MEKTVTTLLEAYKESAKRTRNIFSIINIASILLLISFFNYRFSWQRHLSGRIQFMENKYEWNENYIDKITAVKQWLESNPNITYDSVKLNSALRKLDTLPYYSGNQNSEHKEPESYFLSIPIIGIKIYIQDIPLLGGFATSILLTWFFYARRREKSIMNELAEKMKNCKNQYPDLVSQIFYGISFNAIFNTVPILDNDSKVKFKKLSKAVVYTLIFAPVILLGIIQIWDTIENHFPSCGQKHQKYILIDESKCKYLVGEELNYFVSNFKIQNIDTMIQYNTPTFKFADVVFCGDMNRRERITIKTELIIIQILAYLFIIFSLIQTINSMIIIKEEGEYKKMINEEYKTLIESSSNNALNAHAAEQPARKPNARRHGSKPTVGQDKINQKK